MAKAEQRQKIALDEKNSEGYDRFMKGKTRCAEMRRGYMMSHRKWTHDGVVVRREAEKKLEW